MDDRLGQADALQHAFGIALQALVAAIAEPDQPKDFGDAPRALLSSEIGQIGVQLEQLVSGQPVLETEVFG